MGEVTNILDGEASIADGNGETVEDDIAELNSEVESPTEEDAESYSIELSEQSDGEKMEQTNATEEDAADLTDGLDGLDPLSWWLD